MSQDHTEGTCITVVPEDNNVLCVSAVPASSNNNEQEQTSSSYPTKEPLDCPNNNDSNANANEAAWIPTSDLNSDYLLRLPHLEEDRLQLRTSGDQRHRHHNNEDVPILEYQNYPITRFSRKWKRPEVQGFCCLSIEIICLTTLAVLGLQAVGYFDTINEGGHLPLSFSWKILWEFFGNTAIPKKLLDCLYSNPGNGRVIHDDENYGGVDPISPTFDEYEIIHTIRFSNDNDNYNKPILKQRLALVPTMTADRNVCEFSQGQRSLGWLVKFFVVSNFMPVLNVMTSTVMYASLSVRRRKGMQVLLLLPSFFCFFVSIFQQIPISFQYNYFDQALIKEMGHALAQSTPPTYVIPVLDETQFHYQCCGVELPESWEKFGSHMYPPSCCNSTAFNCSELDVIRREHTWSRGCFAIEHQKIHTFERWALILYALKVVAEVGIFCTLSDLSRFDYPPPEVQETSRCDFREYQIKCRGVMHIKGVTKDGRIVAESKYFLPWRLIPSRTDMLNGLQLYMKTDRHQTKGSVEVVKRHNAANFLSEDIQIDLSRRNRGIFVFTLT